MGNPGQNGYPLYQAGIEMKYRAFQRLVVVLLTLFAPCTFAAEPSSTVGERIDRRTVVARHNPVLRELDPFGALSVGNGEFAFTVDVTGLQTFDRHYFEKGIPLETKAHWAWHSFPNPKNYTRADLVDFWPSAAHRRKIPYESGRMNRGAFDWFRTNPHRFPLARLAFQLTKKDGSNVELDDVTAIHQKLDLWTGLIESRYEIEGTPVQVRTVCHPDRDMVAVRVDSPLVAAGRLRVILHFPYAHSEIKNRPPIVWDQPEKHATSELERTPHHVDFKRTLDATTYYTSMAWSSGSKLEKVGPHKFVLAGGDRGSLEFRCQFAVAPITGPLPSVGDTIRAGKRAWQRFWSGGAMIDFGACTDPRAKELERRTILSLYLTRIQYAGSVAPEETGLTHNSWHGKHNVEMVRMHLTHFALWNRVDLMEKGLDWLATILPQARERAKTQGFRGARWPKMVGIDGHDSPGGAVVMIWQQPHPMYLAELSYRAHPDKKTLEKYKDLVFETVEYMADFAAWDEERKVYVLGPPVWPAQENYSDFERNQNPTFELAYWAWGLEMGQEWRRRLGLPRHTQWDHVLKNLAPLPVRDGLYVAIESDPRTWEDPRLRADMPTLLKAYEFFPSPNVDRETMRRTLFKVVETWRWSAKIWGSDYPSIAITAARIGEPEIAIRMLTEQTLAANRYSVSGHCYVRDDLRVFLPANTTLLAAVGMMAGGWDGGPPIPAPGFPKNGRWNVRVEGFQRMP